MRECVITFDKNLSLKYNKSCMFEFKAELEESYLKKDER